jgi:hypothetical protein
VWAVMASCNQPHAQLTFMPHAELTHPYSLSMDTSPHQLFLVWKHRGMARRISHLPRHLAVVMQQTVHLDASYQHGFAGALPALLSAEALTGGGHLQSSGRRPASETQRQARHQHGVKGCSSGASASRKEFESRLKDFITADPSKIVHGMAEARLCVDGFSPQKRINDDNIVKLYPFLDVALQLGDHDADEGLLAHAVHVQAHLARHMVPVLQRHRDGRLEVELHVREVTASNMEVTMR